MSEVFSYELLLLEMFIIAHGRLRSTMCVCYYSFGLQIVALSVGSILFQRFFNSRKPCWMKPLIPLNTQPTWSTDIRKLRQRKRAKLWIISFHKAKKRIFSVELKDVPRPRRPRGKELYHSQWVRVMLRCPQGWNVLPNLIG